MLSSKGRRLLSKLRSHHFYSVFHKTTLILLEVMLTVRSGSYKRKRPAKKLEFLEPLQSSLPIESIGSHALSLPTTASSTPLTFSSARMLSDILASMPRVLLYLVTISRWSSLFRLLIFISMALLQARRIRQGILSSQPSSTNGALRRSNYSLSQLSAQTT